MGKRKMSLDEARKFVPDELPDGAYWAMAHEIAGAEYGDAWEELPECPSYKPWEREKTVPCNICGKKFKHDNYMRQHRAAAHSPAEIEAAQTRTHHDN